MKAFNGWLSRCDREFMHGLDIRNWVQVVSRKKLNSNRENIVLYFVNRDAFSIAIEFFVD